MRRKQSSYPSRLQLCKGTSSYASYTPKVIELLFKQGVDPSLDNEDDMSMAQLHPRILQSFLLAKRPSRSKLVQHRCRVQGIWRDHVQALPNFDSVFGMKLEARLSL